MEDGGGFEGGRMCENPELGGLGWPRRLRRPRQSVLSEFPELSALSPFIPSSHSTFSAFSANIIIINSPRIPLKNQSKFLPKIHNKLFYVNREKIIWGGEGREFEKSGVGIAIFRKFL